MSNIARIQDELGAALQLLNQSTANAKVPSPTLSEKLEISTLKKHVLDLQSQLKGEKDKREKEILRLRLLGSTLDMGTISLTVLARLAGNLASAIQSAAQKLKDGQRLRGKIPDEIIKTLDLRLAGIKSGSTLLYITGNLSSDLFGHSLIEETLENTFKLLEANTADLLIEGVANIGIRSAGGISSFLKGIANSDYDLELSWDSPTGKAFSWSRNRDEILSFANSLDKIKIAEPEQMIVVGKLITASLKGFFEIQDIKGRSFRGNYPSNIIEKMEGLHMGIICKGTINKEIASNQITGLEKIRYTLIDIEPASS